jgi:hypothetical protein
VFLVQFGSDWTDNWQLARKEKAQAQRSGERPARVVDAPAGGERY